VNAIDAALGALGIRQALLNARGLRKYPEATTLVRAEIGADGREYLLVPAAAAAWCDMKATAEGDGITLFLASAYRSVARQTEIIREKLDAGRELEDILALCAPPGYSEHHTGRAIDIACPDAPPLEAAFEQTRAFRWLSSEAAGFGFSLSFPRGNAAGYQFEPWHWCYRQP
jgi:D-alanyl-D-alanine carboxypeptidase